VEHRLHIQPFAVVAAGDIVPDDGAPQPQAVRLDPGLDFDNFHT
jgi:hypothetical protein